jgi:hypothetical protein
MADMEIVLVSYISFVSFDNFFHLQTNTIDDFGNEILTWQPEKKNPGLTPMDWVKFLISAIVGLVSSST